MAWDQVGGGPIGNGDRYEIDRRVIHLSLQGNAHWPIPLGSYRWRLIRPDGAQLVQATAPTREKIDAAVGAYRSGVADIADLPDAQPGVDHSAPKQGPTGRSGPGVGSGGSSKR